MVNMQKKQYIISANALDLSGMILHKLDNGYLYTDPQLSVMKAVSNANKVVWVIGNAYCMDASPKSVCEDVEKWDGKDVAQLTRFWTGRWVLLCDDTLITDACGLMAAFYTATESDWIISSSLGLIANIKGVVQEEVCEQSGLNWQLLPGTFVDDVKKLCSTQKLKFTTARLQCEPYIWQEDYTASTTEEKSAQMCMLLTNACRNIAASERPLYLALTGGKDSRLVFAALLNSGVPFETYTTAYPNISYADKTLPATMSKAVGIRHTYIKRGKYSSENAEKYRQFSCGNSNGMDGVFYAHGQFDQIPSNAIVIRSGIFEAGQSYGRTIAGNTKESFESGIYRYYAAAFTKSRQREAFVQWLRWIEDYPVPYLDIRDRFYIEQRVGGWASAIEQSLDINDFTSIQIANCPRLLSILLSATESERKNISIAMQSIQAMKPELMKYPVNKKTVWDKMYFCFAVMRNPVKRFRNLINRYQRK